MNRDPRPPDDDPNGSGGDPGAEDPGAAGGPSAGGPEPADDPDLELFMAGLRTVQPQARPAPAGELAAAAAVFAVRGPGVPTADLVGDSVEAPAGALRAVPDGGPRYLLLRTREAEIRLEVTGSGGHRDIVGRLSPARSGSVEVRNPGSARDAPLDRDGAFTSRGVPRGPVRLLFRADGRPLVATPWLTV
ncbi:hypothetical protein [Nocardiopsis sp. CNT-189]|uniref:hypothetical protein n=1 Tax=Nocardiopsis oceanisediminis TaxID=2816862 RepID=UPI003B3A0960